MSRKRFAVIVALGLVGVLVGLVGPVGQQQATPAFAATKKSVTLENVGGTGAAALAVPCVGIYDRVSTAAEVRNNTDNVATRVKVMWQLFDSSGREIKTTGVGSAFGVSESITIPPHQTGFAVPGDIELPVGAPPPTRFRARVSGYRLQKHVEEKYPTGTIDVAKLSLDFSGLSYQDKPGLTTFGTTFCPGARLAGTITNHSGVDIPASTVPGANNRVHVNCALYNGKKIIGGFFTFIAAVPNGASAPFQGGNGLVGGLSPSNIRCSAELGI